MKKISLICLVLAGALMIPALAQEQQPQKEEKILVPVSELSPEQVARARAEASLAKIRADAEQAGAYAKWVDEFGVGIAELSHELTDGSIKFGQTKLGRTIMFLIGFKVLGDYIFGFIVGLPLLLFVVYVFVYTWRRNCMEWTWVKRRKVDSVPWYMFLGRHTKIETETEDAPSSDYQWSTLGFAAAGIALAVGVMLL